jgi:hypothetical protein
LDRLQYGYLKGKQGWIKIDQAGRETYDWERDRDVNS